MRVSFKTLGCRLNQAETATMEAQFQAAGYDVTRFGSPCDVVVIHGCTVTQNAEKESARLVRTARNQPGGKPVVVLAGCPAVVQAAHGNTERDGQADLLAPHGLKFSLPAIIHERFSIGDKPPPAPKHVVPRFSTVRARVKVQDGCNCRCAYCVVPAARGSSVSRPFQEIVDEVEALGNAGYREIILTGANLGCYSDGKRRLVDLLKALESVKPVQRIRLSSIEPATDENDVIDFMASSGKLCRHLHIPLQTGDDSLLSLMGRCYTTAEFRRIVEHMAANPGCTGLGTDLIAGLPGESGNSFEATYKFVEDLPFSNLHVFPYSKRPHTRAAAMDGQVASTVRKERATRLIELGRSKKDKFARGLIGRKVSILIENADANGFAAGWTSEYVWAAVPGADLRRNQIVSGIAKCVDNGILIADRVAQLQSRN